MKLLNKILKFIFSRVVIVSFLLLVQIFILIMAVWKLGDQFVYFYVAMLILSFSTVIWLISKRDNPSIKLAWTIPILLVPLFGGIFYLIFGSQIVSQRMIRNIRTISDFTVPFLPDNQDIWEEIRQSDVTIAKQSKYIKDYSTFPVYKNTITEYLPLGEIKFDRLKKELQNAQHFIFLEYFIIQEGIMWNSILDILKSKVEQGLDVRVMYDDMGCINTLPHKYYLKLEKMGIKTKVFNPFRAVLDVKMNNRDHRKIAIIDGHTAFTGGINLADEYINAFRKHGHWKDSSIMLKGDAVWNLTIMFIQAWNLTNSKTDIHDYQNYMPRVHHETPFPTDGYVQPFGDSPLDDETINELAYINLINNAKRYVYITTPYLIIDNELMTALTLAAKSGIDVRIITPHIADKWYVHVISRANYAQLIQAGVKIYEYTPGFIHSKTFVVDDVVGIVGTTNLDYRSLYMHFENSVWMYQTKSLLMVRDDFLNTLSVCHQVTLEDTKKVRLGTRLIRSLLRVFSPLL